MISDFQKKLYPMAPKVADIGEFKSAGFPTLLT
jgi:hypothetical protein